MRSISEIEETKQVYDANIYTYLRQNKLLKKVLFLSRFHYYYNQDEIKNINTIVLLKKLNEIKNLDNTIYNIFVISKRNITISGSFIDSKNSEINKYKLFQLFSEFIGEKVNRKLSLNKVKSYFAAYNFKMINTTQINGITYFHAKKIK